MNVKKARFFKLCDIYVVLYVLNTYASLFIRSSIAIWGTLIPMIVISLCYYFLAFSKYKSQGFISALILLLSFLSLYGVVYMLGGSYVPGTKPYRFLLSVINSLSPVLIFYVSTMTGSVNDKKMRIYYVLFIIIAIIRFRFGYIERDLNVEGDYSNAGFTNNAAYLFVCLLPCVFLFDKKPIIQYVCLLGSVFFIMNGMKRGAIVTSVVFLVYYLWQSFHDQSFSKRKKWVRLLMLPIAIYAIFYIVDNYWLNNDYFYKRLDDIQNNDSNGRDGIYAFLFDNFLNNTNIIQKIFGLGAEGTLRVAQIYAHNDWLELLTDAGILGFFLFFYYFYSMIKDCRKYKLYKPEVQVLISCFIVLFVRSFFSMSIFDMYIGVSSILGYSFAICQQKSQLEESWIK